MAKNSYQSQRGMALVVGLIMTLVATIIVMSSMRGSQFQEGMTANLNNKAISFMAAEAGATEFWKWLADEEESGTINWDDATWQAGWQDTIPSNQSENHNAGQVGYFWIDPGDVQWGLDHVQVTITGQSGLNIRNPLGVTRIQLRLDRPTSSSVNPAFMTGLLANGNIQINGNAALTGSAHANGNFEVTGGNSSLNDRAGTDDEGNPITITSTVSGQGAASMKGGINPNNVISGAQPVSVPSADAYIEANKAGAIESCNIPSGDLKGAVYFCAGNATTSGNFSNATILATGNVSHNGASQLGGSELTVMIVAGGNITINGSNDTYGVFWAEGNVTQNGSSILGGSIVAGGNITRNGKFNYVQYDNFGNLNMPLAPPSGLAIRAWAEVI